jgi:maltose/maltodextrin transport system substrate-binding protein
MNRRKPLGIPALISSYNKMAQDNALLRQLKTCVDHSEVMPNVPQMSRFYGAVGAALQIATEGRASVQASLRDAEVNIRPGS